MWAERLRDGEQILIRPIRPEDREELAAVEPDTEHGIGWRASCARPRTATAPR
jgi:hypothetical protein